jgi:hypothetical protein
MLARNRVVKLNDFGKAGRGSDVGGLTLYTQGALVSGEAFTRIICHIEISH